MRGIRKCSACGTFNGNRALKCKNQACQQKLKEVPSAVNCNPSSALIAVQLLQTGSTIGQLYSVRDGQGLRNIIRSNVGADGTIGSLTIIQGREIADVKNLTPIISSCKSIAEAVPLLKEAINTLAISEEEKLSLWDKYCHPGGNPLVQRASNDLYVVGHSQATYGLTHVVATKKNQKYSIFHCDCQANGHQQPSPIVCWHVHAVVAGLLSAPEKFGDRWTALLQQFVGQKSSTVLDDAPDENSVLSYEYLLASDDAGYISVPNEHIEIQSMLNSSYMELFNDEEHIAMVTDETARSMLPTTCIPDIFSGGEESLHLMDCQIELMDELDPTDRIDFCPSFIECEDSLPVSEAEENTQAENVVRITTKKSALKRCGRMAPEKLTRGSYSVRKLMKTLESNGIIFKRLQRVSGAKTDGNVLSPTPIYEAMQCNLSFTCWLESVIEQLNSVIDYNTDGKPAVQTFRIQRDFFHCLRARFSVGFSLRQPEPAHSTDAENDRSQLYKFTHHKSLLHVFRTDKIALCFEKKFTRGADDRYVPLELTEDDKNDPLPGEQNRTTIRPHCYSTYIKLGRYRHEPDPERVYHFSLEWIDGVLPRSGFGDLRISFQYGHRMNNQYTGPPGTLHTV
uniref:Putative treble-clef zinc-finger domain-containing protein n=1 Tax=Anopheles culicifacies TaxID=139723 RepID=A0A182MGP0_9DIPT